MAGERILDLGCGDGVLTEALVAHGCTVVGVDASAAQVEAARRRGLDARVADGQQLAFDREFDAVFSNAAMHWMTEPDRVIAGVWRALRPGGRFVGELGGRGCVARIVAALRGALARQGIDESRIQPWYFPGDLADWLETFGESFLAAARDRGALLEAVRAELRPHLCDPDGRWTADYVRLRFAAAKPAA